MDQRRFITFLLLSVGIMMLFTIMFPPPDQTEKPAKAPGAAAKDKQARDDKAADQPAAVAKDNATKEAEKAAQTPPAPGAPPAPLQPGGPLQVAPLTAGQKQGTPQYVTLGSLDPTTGYRMLVTLTRSGAAVRRAEMSSPRYADQHEWVGYLGELELTEVNGGLQVQVVGPGTPAATAKPTPIVKDDVIIGIGDGASTKPLRTVKDLRAALSKTEPGKTISLQVRSGMNEPQTKQVVLGRKPLAVVRPEIDNYEMRQEKPPAGFVDPPSFIMSLASVETPALASVEKPARERFIRRLTSELEKGDWVLSDVTAQGSQESVATFTRALPELQLELVKRYRLTAVPQASRQDPDFPGYHITLEIEIRNASETPQTVAYRIGGPTGMPLEGWWYAHKFSRSRWFGGAGLRDVIVRFDDHSLTQFDGPKIAADEVAAMEENQALAYAGVDGQYFAAVMIPDRKSLGDVWFDSTEAIRVGPKPPPRPNLTFTNVTCRMTSKPLDLGANGTERKAFQIFIGPKRPTLLAQYKAAKDPNYSLQDVIYYGLSLFGFIARAMLAVLHFFYGIVGNYGIAIIMLTVLVRGLMFPISFKQTQNMARMQALKPEMDRITEKYKTDMQKRSQAIQELYRKHDINPLGGCLPVFLQLPIFIGLYRSLMVDVELRLSPLFSDTIRWCSNLAAPDMLYDWSWFMPESVNKGQGFFGLGPYFNILPIITVSLFLVTQKLAMPAPTNEQAAMQQKMMKYMTMFMGLLFYKVASGLCLYFIASSLWGIAERRLLPKAKVPDAAELGGSSSTSVSSSRRPSSGGNGSLDSKRARKVKKKK